MKAQIEATLTREEVAAHFEQWRSTKKKGDWIPERLWREAISLLSEYSIAEVTRTLRLSGTDLKKRQAALAANKDPSSSESPIEFVEVDRPVIDQSIGATDQALVLELERADGVRLRIHGTNGVGMLALVERFLGAGACCS